jgi:RNA polymerase sigma factor (TIGR02999 family)
MHRETGQQVDQLVERSQAGDQDAAALLLPLVYDELRRIAGAYMRRERPGQTLQPTALVHEAYLRLLSDKQQDWRGRTHFLAIAAISMRQILVERARAKQTHKRGGGRDRITLDETHVANGAGSAFGGDVALDLLAIDDALGRLAELDAQQARVVELRFFGGMTIDETAATLDVSPATVKRHWTLAKAWLRREVGAGGAARRSPGGVTGESPGEAAEASTGDDRGGGGS